MIKISDHRNNIFSLGGAWGIEGDPGVATTIDANAWYENALGPCSVCAPGSNAVFQDPLYVDSSTEDLRLLPDSSCIDAGVDLGVDTNGAAVGTFNGTAPDLGAWEAPYG